MNTEIINKIAPLLEKYHAEYKDSLEVEFRIGYIENNSFNTNISQIFFDKIKSNLDNSLVFKKKHNVYTDTSYQDPVNKFSKIRHSTFDNSFTKKTKLCAIDIASEPFDIRVSFSIEEPVKDHVKEDPDSNKKSIRNKDRNSYLYKYWSYDLTKVTHTENSLDITEYEIELEITNILQEPEFYNYVIESSVMKLFDLAKMCESDISDITKQEFTVHKEHIYTNK